MLDKLQTVKIIVNSNLTQTLHPYCTSNCANVFSFSFLSTHLSIIQLSNVFSLQASNTKGNLLKPPLSIQLIISSLSLVFNTLLLTGMDKKRNSKLSNTSHFYLTRLPLSCDFPRLSALTVRFLTFFCAATLRCEIGLMLLCPHGMHL